MLTRSRRAGSTVLGVLLVLAAAALLGAACGGDDNTSATTAATIQPSVIARSTRSPAPSPTAASTATTAPAGLQTLEVTEDNFFFQPKEFTAKAGQKVTFNIKNNATTNHNMRVAGVDKQYNTADDAVSKNQTIAAGQTSTLEWTAPATAGTYYFHCDFHPTQMTGTITVQ